MRAVQYSRYGGPEVLVVVDIPEPHAGPGQVRIRVRAAAVNPYDHKVRSGMFAGGAELARPAIPGAEAAGVVDEVGDGVAGTRAGDHVFGLATGGASAELAVLTHWAPKPGNVTFEEAAGLTVVCETAERALRLLDLRGGETLLVHGAAGGVGQAALQLARLRGATVIGTASERNHELLRSLGAIPTSYDPGLPARVASLAPQGVDAVLDAAGTALDELLEIQPARVVSIANYTAGDHGVRLTTGGGDEAAFDVLPWIADLVTRGEFRLRVAAAFPAGEAAAAHRLSESRSAGGKIVLLF
ncbi:MAG: NADP-dependent oxidoreductase [Actinomycetota bacterium]